MITVPGAPSDQSRIQVGFGSSWARRRCVRSALSVARDVWQPASNDAHVDMERVTALVERDLGKLDVAEHLVASLVRRWNDSSEHRRSVLADIALAELHVRVGEPRGTSLAHQSISDGPAVRHGSWPTWSGGWPPRWCSRRCPPRRAWPPQFAVRTAGLGPSGSAVGQAIVAVRSAAGVGPYPGTPQGG